MAIQLFTPLPDPPLPTDPEAVFDEKAGIFLTAEQRFANVDINGKLIPGINAAVEQVEASEAAAASSASAAAGSASAANTAKLAAQQAVTEAGAAGAAQVKLAQDQVALAADQVHLTIANGQAQVQLAAEHAQLATTNGQAQVDAATGIKNQTATIRDQAQLLADAMQTAAGVPSYSDKKGWIYTVKEDGSGLEWRQRHRVGEVVQMAGTADSTWLPLTGGIYLQSAYPELYAKIGLIGAVAGSVWAPYSTVASAVNSSVVGKDGVIILTLIGQTSSLYKSNDNGLTWSLQNLSAVIGDASATVYCLNTDGKGVWVLFGYSVSSSISWFALRSTDNGVTWVKLTGSGTLPNRTMRAVATDKNGVWMAGGGVSSTELWRSTDDGLTWKQIVSGGNGSGEISGIATDRLGNWVATLSSAVITSSDNGLTFGSGFSTGIGTGRGVLTNEKGVWMVYGATSTGTSGLSKSIDNGKSWSPVPQAQGGTSPVFSGATDNEDGWYFGTSIGTIIRSTDKTITWSVTPITTTGFLNTEYVYSLVMQGSDLLAIANTGSANVTSKVRRSNSVTPYDSSTLFKVPDLPVYKGLTSRIKAKEVA